MTFMRLSGLALGAVLLSSCAPQWVNSGRPNGNYNKDRAACKRLDAERVQHGSSRLLYGTDPNSTSLSPSWKEGEQVDICMKNKGWERERPVNRRN
ncbi:MAG: hypothetical protein Q7R35_11480 [Elusimicrobiota bacterium]|nr:hypothetical protein [Elusimicrobiota bacterium]